MTDTEFGLNTFIKHNGTNKYIVVQDLRIALRTRNNVSGHDVLLRKKTQLNGLGLAWPSDKRQHEGDLLKLAKDRGVKGIAEWLHHEQIAINGNTDTIAYLRAGLKFGALRKLSSKVSWVITVQSAAGMARLTGLGTSTSGTTTSSSGQKRKRDEVAVDDSGGKRYRSIESHSNMADIEIIVHAEKRELDMTAHHSIQEAKPDRLSVKELLEALYDAIRAHKSLLEDRMILHRGISENNIIITEAATKGDPKGILIDLDLAKELDSLPNGASHRTGYT
ncbi:serine threonine- kinase sgk2 protein [Rutstroemia sp. NJR-2017a BBW]|nr:serine threonine- kinase sgk2 protein [Rutstroemia sp. NJR-2017a BBW]